MAARYAVSQEPCCSLPDRLLEMCVVIGTDQGIGGLKLNRGSVIVDNNSREDKDVNVFIETFDAEVIGTISDQAVQYWRGGSPNYSPEASPQHLATPIRKKSVYCGMKPIQHPIPAATIRTLPLLFLPDGFHIYTKNIPAHFHAQVLTDITGASFYAMCLTMYRPFLVNHDSDDIHDGCVDIQQGHSGRDGNDSLIECYIPTCVVFISKHALFRTLKNLQSLILPILVEGDMFKSLEKYVLHLTMTPVPPPGSIMLQFRFEGHKFLLPAPVSPGEQVVDLNLLLIFQCLSVKNVMKIINCILVEGKLLFMSQNYALITHVMETMLILIRPLLWQFVYVNVIPHDKLDLVGAPQAFLMGCHSRYRQSLPPHNDVILVDIDSNTIDIPESTFLPTLPEKPHDTVVEQINKLTLSYELFLLDKPVQFVIGEMRKDHQQFQDTINEKIQQIFMDFMVDILGGTMRFLNNKGYFNAESFLLSVSADEKPFYETFTDPECDLFRKFLGDRLKLKRDSFAITLDNRSIAGPMSDSTRGTPPASRRRVGSFLRRGSKLFEDEETKYMVELPTFKLENKNSFFKLCVLTFTTELKNESSSNPARRGPLLYLRGTASLVAGDVKGALKDFQELMSSNRHLFPATLISTILPAGNSSVWDDRELRNFYTQPDVKNQINSRNPAPTTGVVFHFDVIPTKPIDLNGFTEKMQILEIVVEIETCTRLFNALTLNESGSGKLDCESFQRFYAAWMENQQANTNFQLSMNIDKMEEVLKISGLVKTDMGYGRLVLTSRQLLFAPQRASECKHVNWLRSIAQLKKHGIYSSLSLRVHDTDPSSPKFDAVLNKERNTWYRLVNEMSMGVKLASKAKDEFYARKASRNVILLDALISSADDGSAMHAERLEEAVNYFTHKPGHDATLHEELKHSLISRLNPSQNEPEPFSVDALVYSPGTLDTNDEDRCDPLLFCAIGRSNTRERGRLVVFNAATWIETHLAPIEPQTRIRCMVVVSQSEVWVASRGTQINVLYLDTLSSNHQLNKHVDLISDMKLTDDKTQMVSASLNGQIFVWNIEKFEAVAEYRLKKVSALVSIQLTDTTIWFCTRNYISGLSLSDGSELPQQYKYSLDGRTVELECFLVTGNELWAGSRHAGIIVAWHIQTQQQICELKFEVKGFTHILQVKKDIWFGTKCGQIVVIEGTTRSFVRQLNAHKSCIRSMTTASDRYVITGSSTPEGRIAIWQATDISHLEMTVP